MGKVIIMWHVDLLHHESPQNYLQVNQITHWLDNSNVYGSGGNDSIEVRRFNRGLLNAEVQLNGEELLPDSGENECRYFILFID